MRQKASLNKLFWWVKFIELELAGEENSMNSIRSTFGVVGPLEKLTLLKYVQEIEVHTHKRENIFS